MNRPLSCSSPFVLPSPESRVQEPAQSSVTDCGYGRAERLNQLPLAKSVDSGILSEFIFL
jgi:hypothetical protein